MYANERLEITNIDLKNIFPRISLPPKIIRLRRVSQEKHVRRMASALEIKEKRRHGDIYSVISPPTPRNNESSFATPKSVRKIGSDIKTSESKKNKENGKIINCNNCALPNICKKDENESELLPNGEFSKSTQTDNCSSPCSENSKQDNVVKELDCKLMKNEAFDTRIPENEKRINVKSIFIRNQIYNRDTNKKNSILLPKNTMNGGLMTNRAEDSEISPSPLKILSETKSESTLYQKASHVSESLFKTPKQSKSDSKKTPFISKIPVPLNQFRNSASFKTDAYAMSSEDSTISSEIYAKTEKPFLPNWVGNLFDTYTNNIKNNKPEMSATTLEHAKITSENWNGGDATDDSSSSLYSCKSVNKIEAASGSSSDKDSAVSLWRKKLSSTDGERKNIFNFSDFVMPLNKTKISGSSEFCWQSIKQNESNIVPDVSFREDILKSKTRGLETGEQFYDSYCDFDETKNNGVLRNDKEKMVNNTDDWKSSDEDFSSASSSQYQLETGDASSKLRSSNTVYDSLSFQEKPKHYCTPYNLRYPRYKPGAYSCGLGSVQLNDNSRIKSSKSIRKYNSTPRWRKVMKSKRSKKNKSACKRKQLMT